MISTLCFFKEREGCHVQEGMRKQRNKKEQGQLLCVQLCYSIVIYIAKEHNNDGCQPVLMEDGRATWFTRGEDRRCFQAQTKFLFNIITSKVP